MEKTTDLHPAHAHSGDTTMSELAQNWVRLHLNVGNLGMNQNALKTDLKKSHWAKMYRKLILLTFRISSFEANLTQCPATSDIPESVNVSWRICKSATRDQLCQGCLIWPPFD